MSLKYPAERILIRCPNWIGDAVAATAAIRCIRQNYPKAHITLLLSPYVRPVFENAPWCDDMIEFDRQRKGWREIFRVGKQLRETPRYDLALLMTHSFSSALAVKLGQVPVRVGHGRNGRSWLLTDIVPWPKKGRKADIVPKVVVYKSLLDYLGCENSADQRPEVFASEQDEAKAAELLKQHNRDAAKQLAAIVPGAAFGASKLWEPARFAKVADWLAKERGFQPVILTGPGEASIGKEIARHMTTPPIGFREGEVPFGALKAIVRQCAVMVCNDTGPRHVAIAYNVPTVVLMGPTDPVVTQSDYPKTSIIRQDVPCAPCYLRICPADHRCMKRITPEMVIGAVGELLERFPGK